MLCLTYVTIDSFGQPSYKTECDSFLYWQPNVRLKLEDYKGDTTTSGMNLCRKYNIHNIANVQICSILDEPKQKRKRGKLLEKVYFAPKFCKYCSFSIKNDSLEILHDQIYFDIAEFCSRTARKKLDSLRLLMPGYGTYWLLYTTVKQDIEDLNQKMCGAYGYQLLVKKDTSAYQSWREMLDIGLTRTKNYATKPEECYRLLSDAPIDGEYQQAETIAGPMKKRD